MNQVKLTSCDDKLTFSLFGDIDASCSDAFFDAVSEAYERDKKDILFECGELNFVDSTAIGVFVKICKMARGDGYSLTLNNLSSRIQNLFKVCNLGDIMGLQ